MKRNTFILKSFLQFICTNSDGSQKEGGNFLNLLQKEGGEGVLSQKGGSNPGGNYAIILLTLIFQTYLTKVNHQCVVEFF